MKTIILCGSMKVKQKLINIGNTLTKRGYEVLLPLECINGIEKTIASKAHFDRIVESNNSSILVINESKDDIENYIGPNTFAEIALAFYFNRPIYLLNDLYKPYIDELLAWNVIPLRR